MNSQKEMEIQLPSGRGQLNVEVYVRFGNPNYDDCRNFGICKMELASDKGSFFRKKKQYAKAILRKEKEEIWIYFIKASMSAKTRSFYFGKGSFLIEKTKVVEGGIAVQLNEGLLIFNYGEYAVTETVKYLIMRVTS